MQSSGICEAIYPFLPWDFTRRYGITGVNYLPSDKETDTASLYIGIFTVDFIVNAIFCITSRKRHTVVCLALSRYRQRQ